MMMILVVVARCSGGLLVIRDEETSNQATILHKSLLLSAQHEADGVFLGHGPLLLDRSVCLPLFAMWPSFGYFSTVI